MTVDERLEYRDEVSRKATAYRNAFIAYCRAETEPDVLDLAAQFNLHPSNLVKVQDEQQWLKRRATYWAAKDTTELAWRMMIAKRIDAHAIKEAEPMIKKALRDLNRIMDKVSALPLEPTDSELADKDEGARVQLRVRYLNRKLDLTERATKSFMDTLERAANVGLLINYERRHLKDSDDEKGALGIDFSKLAALKITVETVTKEHAAELAERQAQGSSENRQVAAGVGDQSGAIELPELPSAPESGEKA